MCTCILHLSVDSKIQMSKPVAFADNKSNMSQNIGIILERTGNIFRKRRKWWIPAVSPFPHKVFKSCLNGKF